MDTSNGAPKVLIVEDDKHIAEALGIRLRHHGLRAVLAHDVMSATRAAREEQPDVAVLDISMPGGNGFDVADRLRKFVSPDVPLIFLTANMDPAAREAAFGYDPIAYLRKPYVADEVIAAVGAAL